MTITVLYLDFIDNEGKRRSISIDEPLDDITDSDIKNSMDTIIEKDIFEDYKLVSASGARLVTKTIEDIHIE